MSKYVLSNIFHFLPLKDALRVRSVSKKFDEACFIGLKICVVDMQEYIDKYLYIVSKDFSQESIEEHKTLREHELQINVLLRQHLLEAKTKRSNLFSTYPQIAYLVRPNHLIIKPIFAVMVLI